MTSITPFNKYPNAPYGMEVSEGGPSANTLSKELEHMTEQLRNISDEDLYRVYHERWVNPDRIRSGQTVMKGDWIPTDSQRSRRLMKWLQSGSRLRSVGSGESVAEYVRDRDALQRERLLHYMIDPNLELLEDESLLGALFPDVESAKYPAFEMYKYKIKVENLHPYTYAIWDNVRQFYAREDQIDKLLSTDEPRVGALPFQDPIKAYESLYDPINQLIRTVAARTGDFMHHGNPDDEINNDLANLYDHEEMLDIVSDEEPWSDEFSTIPPEMFVMYAKAMRDKAAAAYRFKPKESNNPNNIINLNNLDRADLDYWSEIVAPFEYEPKEAPMDRPLFIEVPHVEVLRLGKGTWRPNASKEHSFWAKWSWGMDKSHLYGETGQRTLDAARLARDPDEGPGDRFLSPKFSSEVVFDYVSYVPTNPDKVIASTHRTGEPIKFHYGLDSLPKCLDMTIPKFPQGTRLKVVCPPRLLFGYDGWPQRGYPANSEIAFDIEIRKVGEPYPLKSSIPFYHDHDNPTSLF